MTISAHDLSFSYPLRTQRKIGRAPERETRPRKRCSDVAPPLLNKLNFTVADGEKVAIIGRSGCGKSTLLRLLTGLYRPTSGRICFTAETASGQKYPPQQHDLGAAPGAELRIGDIALMTQSSGLFQWRTVLENLLIPAEIKGADLQAATQRARELLEEFALSDAAEKYPEELSGGMSSRINFLRTLLAQPRAIALDEPFAALDALTREETAHWLQKQLEKHVITTFLVTHDVDEAILLSDRVYLLRAGESELQQFSSSTCKNRASGDFAALREEIMQQLRGAD